LNSVNPAAGNWQILVRNSRHLGVVAAGHRDCAFVDALFRTAQYRDGTPGLVFCPSELEFYTRLAIRLLVRIGEL
jgi:hypothetical protein